MAQRVSAAALDRSLNVLKDSKCCAAANQIAEITDAKY
jgi:hypothetical protein